jgi:hypothetical protein
MVVVNHHHDDDDTDKEEACISFLNSLFLSLSLSLTPRSIISVVLSVNVLLVISVVCFCVFEKKCLLLLLL